MDDKPTPEWKPSLREFLAITSVATAVSILPSWSFATQADTVPL